MSEFKFACPVCGQHITADSSSSGGHIECPTCFQKIIVPQAPADPDSKLILSAAQVGKPRPISVPTTELGSVPRSSALVPTLVGLFLLCGTAAAVFLFRDHLFKSSAKPVAGLSQPNSNAAPATPLKSTFPIPTNFVWSLDLTNVAFPDTVASGSVHGEGFRCERAILQGGNLSLRQGKTNPPDLLLQLRFAVRQGEDLAGKVLLVSPDRPPPLPTVTVQRKEDPQHSGRRAFKSGYALKISFGLPANGRIPGRLFLCLPDAEKSFVAGTFDAELRKPPPPKPAPSKPHPAPSPKS